MMKKYIFFITILLLIGGGITLGINRSKQSVGTTKEKFTVVTTLFPLYDFVKNIGGDFVDVTLLLPPGVEAHSFEPKPSDIVRIDASDLFVYTGKFMEPWAEDIIKGVTNKNMQSVDASIGIDLMKLTPGMPDEANGLDPHIWLDFDNDKKMIHTLTSALIAKDPLHTAYYHNREEDYMEKFIVLDYKYKLSLENCATKEVIYGGHYAFGYLAHRYALEYLAAQGLAPDAEPTPRDLIKLVDQVKKNNIKYVFYEELTSPKIAETIAKETNAKMLLLNASHNVSKEDIESGVSFLDIMEANRASLTEGLQCE